MRWLVILCVSACLLEAQEPEVSFSRQIAPILKERCLACHSAEKAKGGYSTQSFAAASKPGRSGAAALVAGAPESSELFKRLITKDEDDRMPQESDPLPAEQIEWFRRWIAEGAKLDLGSVDADISSLAMVSRAPAPAKYPRPLPVLALACDPAGDQIAVGGYREITFWSGGKLARRIGDAPERIRGLAIHPSGSHAVLAGGKAGRAGEVSVYDLETGAIETNLVRTGDEMLAVTFSPDGGLLAASGSDNTIHVFAWSERRKLCSILQHADWVTALSFDGSGERLASASRDRTARVYKARPGDLVTTYPAHAGPVFAVAFLEGNVASGGRDRTVHLWEPEDGKSKARFGGGSAEILAMIAGTNSVFIAGHDGSVREFAIRGHKPLRNYTHEGSPVFALALNAAKSQLATGTADGRVRIWDCNTGELMTVFAAAPGWQED